MGRRRIALAVALYTGLAALGWGWCAFRGRPDALHHPEPWLALDGWTGALASIAAGLVLALATLGATRALVRHARWARSLHLEFRRLLGPMGPFSIAVLAIGSSVGEEVFFRGALQPSIGYIATSIVFGLVHIGPTRRFLPWTAWAVAMGFLLGAIHQATGWLLGPLIAHAWINYENLRFIASYDPSAPGETKSADAPRLVGRARRI